MLYGPAYKGIPLATAVTVAYSLTRQRDVPYAFNRKETKDHGEGGATVGAALDGSVLIVDDVVSAGTSTRESVDIIRAAGARPTGLAICLDRQEPWRRPNLRHPGRSSGRWGLRVVSIITLDHLVRYLEARGGRDTDLGRIHAYRAQYGTTG